MSRDLESGRIELNAVALPLADQLVVIAPDGAVAALNSGGRRLWEALQAGWSVTDLVEASVLEGSLPREVARRSIAGTLASWRALGLVGAPARNTDFALMAGPAATRCTPASRRAGSRPSGTSIPPSTSRRSCGGWRIG